MADDTRTILTDPVLALAEYFLSASYMHDLVHMIRTEWSEDPEEHWQEFRTYYGFWLAALYVVVEGFIELGLDRTKVPEIGDPEVNLLRLFRNGTFHFQRDPTKTVQFHAPGTDTMNWAERLHGNLAKFFYDYTHPK